MNAKTGIIKALAAAARVVNGQPLKAMIGGDGHILMFHRVQPASNAPRIVANSYLEVTPEFLGWTIDYFRRYGYDFLSLEEIASLAGRKSKRPFVSYTFDDGFRDNLEHALPVFKEKGVPFSIFVATNFPDRKAVIWWNALERLVLDNDRLTFALEGGNHVFHARDLAEKQSAFRSISHLIKHGSEQDQQERAKAFLAQFGIDPFVEVRKDALSWSEIKALAREPLVTIGAHSVTHPVLSHVNPSALRAEITGSKHQLEAATGKPVLDFAYPFGGMEEFGTREIEAVKAAGYRLALTTMPYSMKAAYLDNLYFLPRIAVGMSMNAGSFDLLRYGVLPLARNRAVPLAKRLYVNHLVEQGA